MATHAALLHQFKSFVISHLLLAERVGFEPTCRLPDKTLSRRPRYDHFGTSPLSVSR